MWETYHLLSTAKIVAVEDKYVDWRKAKHNTIQSHEFYLNLAQSYTWCLFASQFAHKSCCSAPWISNNPIRHVFLSSCIHDLCRRWEKLSSLDLDKIDSKGAATETYDVDFRQHTKHRLLQFWYLGCEYSIGPEEAQLSTVMCSYVIHFFWKAVIVYMSMLRRRRYEIYR